MAQASRRPEAWTLPTTPFEAEAWLRRRIGDPHLALVDRLAAATVLMEPSDWRPRDPIRFAGILSPGTDTGLIGPNPVLSPTQADSYTT